MRRIGCDHDSTDSTFDVGESGSGNARRPRSGCATSPERRRKFRRESWTTHAGRSVFNTHALDGQRIHVDYDSPSGTVFMTDGRGSSGCPSEIPRRRRCGRPRCDASTLSRFGVRDGLICSRNMIRPASRSRSDDCPCSVVDASLRQEARWTVRSECSSSSRFAA